MEYHDKVFCLEVRGDFACFTRPEMKVERVSYDVPTPSAVRGVFEAIFWKPAIRWRVRKIEVLNPIRWTSVRRNEVSAVMSERGGGMYIEDNRQQRAGLLLQDVAYRFHAALEFIPRERRSGTANPAHDLKQGSGTAGIIEVDHDENPGKYNAIFERRAQKGQCFNQPYLGCREFSCSFKLVDPAKNSPPPVDETRELGFMLYDMDFSKEDDIRPAFFKAKIEHGVVMVPPWESEEVRR